MVNAVEESSALTVHVDATAGLGIANRRGAGRIRHIATPTLWIQRLVSSGAVWCAPVWSRVRGGLCCAL